MILKTRKCKHCKQVFQKTSPLHSICSPLCAIAHAEKLRLKREALEVRKSLNETKAKLAAIRPMIKLFNEAQAAVNAYIRERDAKEYCISCGRWHNGQWHAGHFRTVGAAGHLRFNEDNIHKQCAPCNNDLSGNLVNYRIKLIKKIGINRVDALESNNAIHKWTREELIEMKLRYKQKLKELKSQERLAA